MRNRIRHLAVVGLLVLMCSTGSGMAKVGYPSRDARLDVLPGFVKPPAGYGEVPFYWWLGDPLTKERLSWHLDMMKGMGISGMQINYAHSDKGGNIWGLTYPSEPPLFSEEWWELVRWWSGECKKQGIAISLSDYTLGIVGQGYWMDEILEADPNMRGRVLQFGADTIAGGQTYTAQMPENLISVEAYRLNESGEAVINSGADLRSNVDGRTLTWNAPEGQWRVAKVSYRVVQNSVDPINQKLGPMIIERFFGRFEDKLPGEAGSGLNFFFSDELNFGIGGMLWNDRFAQEFQKRKAYDIIPYLPALFEDIGPATPKIRLDYYDVMVSLSEESYFKPVFDWHNDRGMVYGCDHGGRGLDVTEFGDYFRTQRWMTGPGCDQPMLAADIVKNKVAASIAHLYERPRVWLEGYHSSGWGTSSADLTSATLKNFAMGQNLLSLHGLYYSTHGGFWEWAPPCNHFRMPYWAHMREWMACLQRLSYLMSQGVHKCDVAMLYPVAPKQAGTDAGNSVGTAFDTGRRLYEQGVDFDYIDTQSIERAVVKGRELTVAGEAYQVLVLPAMQAVHWSTLEKAKEFKDAGGIVVALGVLPEASDHGGRHDAELTEMVRWIFGDKPASYEQLDNLLKTRVVRDFVPQAPCYVNHRKMGPRDVYMVVGAPKGSECFFRAKGRVELWDPWTGSTSPVYTASETDGGTKVRMPLSASEAQLIVFSPGEPNAMVTETDLDDVTGVTTDGDLVVVTGYSADAGRKSASVVVDGRRVTVSGESPSAAQSIDLSNPWEFELKPCLDNRFGDYRLPITDSTIGAEARRFSYVQDPGHDVPRAKFQEDAATVTCGYGQKFWVLGPVHKEADTDELERALAEMQRVDPIEPVSIGGRSYTWKPYSYGLRWGVEGDPGHEGYHGLKNNVSGDFIALGRRNFNWTDSFYSNESDDAGRYYLWTAVRSENETSARFVSGGMAPSAVWLNGTPVADLGKPVQVSAGASPLLLRYEQAGRGHILLQSGEDIPAPEYPLAMQWYMKPGILAYDPLPRAVRPVGWYRFVSPPGLRSMTITAQGELRAWAEDCELEVTPRSRRQDGAVVYSVTVEGPVPEAREITLRIQQRRGYYGGEAIPEPVALECGPGVIPLGDWSTMGSLECYSGGAWYRKTVELTPEQADGRVILKLGDVVSSAEVRVNGRPAGVKLAPPWEVDISRLVRPGSNRIEILVYNTIANHYVTIPTRYRGSIKSGLIGPVSIDVSRTVVLK